MNCIARKIQMALQGKKSVSFQMERGASWQRGGAESPTKPSVAKRSVPKPTRSVIISVSHEGAKARRAEHRVVNSHFSLFISISLKFDALRRFFERFARLRRRLSPTHPTPFHAHL